MKGRPNLGASTGWRGGGVLGQLNLAMYVVRFHPKADAGTIIVYRPPKATGWLVS